MSEIDVNRCDYYNNKTKRCRIPHYADDIKFVSCKCEEVKKCYYKQLQQLKQENNELKNEIKIYKSVQWDIKTVDELYTTKALKEKESEIYEIYREQKKQLINTEQKLKKIEKFINKECEFYKNNQTKDKICENCSNANCLFKDILQIIESEEE